MIGYEALRDGAAAVSIDAIGLVELRGPDALSFLQSLASQDLDGLALGETRHSLLLEPQGKLIADFLVLRVDDDTLWLRCEPEVAPTLTAGLARFKIRVKVDMVDRSAELAALHLRGPQVAAQLANATWPGPRFTLTWGDDVGYELVGAAADLAAFDPSGFEPADREALEVRRIEGRIPRQPADIDERTIAQEALLDQTAVSFTKGCFVGQELVCRIGSRGHVNRTLRRVRFEAPVAVGTEVELDAKVIGTVTSAAVSPELGPIGLATLRRECPAGAVVQVGTTTGTTLD